MPRAPPLQLSTAMQSQTMLTDNTNHQLALDPITNYKYRYYISSWQIFQSYSKLCHISWPLKSSFLTRSPAVAEDNQLYAGVERPANDFRVMWKSFLLVINSNLFTIYSLFIHCLAIIHLLWTDRQTDDSPCHRADCWT